MGQKFMATLTTSENFKILNNLFFFLITTDVLLGGGYRGRKGPTQ